MAHETVDPSVDKRDSGLHSSYASAAKQSGLKSGGLNVQLGMQKVYKGWIKNVDELRSRTPYLDSLGRTGSARYGNAVRQWRTGGPVFVHVTEEGGHFEPTLNQEFTRKLCYRKDDRAMRPIYRLFHPNFVHAYVHYFARIPF